MRLTYTAFCDLVAEIDTPTPPDTMMSNQNPKISSNVFRRSVVSLILTASMECAAATEKTSTPPGQMMNQTQENVSTDSCRVHFYGNSSPPLGKSLGEKEAMGNAPCTCICSMRNILEISSIRQNTPELPAQEGWTDWKELKENLQMENLEKQKTEIPPTASKKKKTQPTTIFGRDAKEEATKKQPKNCASLRQTPLNGDGRYHWVGFRAGCAVSKEIVLCWAVEDEFDPQVVFLV